MKDEEKSKEQLLKELLDLRRTVVASNNGSHLKEEYNKTKENEQKYYNLFQNSNDAIFIQDLNGRIIDVNKKLLLLFGYDQSEIMSISMADLVNATEESKYRSALESLVSDGATVFEIDLKRKNGEPFPAEVSASTFAVNGEKVVQGIVRNISERKRAEEEFRKYRKHLEAFVAQRTDQLEAANKELESFAYSVSHDLRAPLRAMEGFASALLEDYAEKLDETGRDYAHRVVSAAQHMDILIQDLLAYSRLSRSALKPNAVSLDGVLGEVMHQLSSDIQKMDAQIRVERPLPEVMGDHATLVQVLSNLLSNAIKFVEPDVKPKVNIWAETLSSRVRLWVEDAGIGIAPEYHDRIFRIFERLQGMDAYPGTGVGLAIVKKGLERMGGKAGVDSAPGRGSKFWVELRAKGF
ncbi:MAG: PAS domain S-box protein [candidate division WOR-3 bacterium]|nr:PAS domain S-box protein [candidate division WOR-3 bacterium]